MRRTRIGQRRRLLLDERPSLRDRTFVLRTDRCAGQFRVGQGASRQVRAGLLVATLGSRQERARARIGFRASNLLSGRGREGGVYRSRARENGAAKLSMDVKELRITPDASCCVVEARSAFRAPSRLM